MYKNLMEYGRSLLSQCALDATGFLSNVYKKGTRAKKFLADDVQGGKSMIEMLGVLAIIAVLSVGGIAGYSKAMEKFKVNKLVAEYGEVLRGLIEYREHFLRVNPDKQTGLAEALQAADVVPNNWLRKDAIWFTDSQDNSVAFYSSKNDIAKGVSMDIYLGGMTKVEDKNISENFSEKLCVEILSNLALPLSMDITTVSVASYVKNWKSKVRYGAKYCSVENGNCLAQSSLADFQNMCKFCEGQEGECNIGIRF